LLREKFKIKPNEKMHVAEPEKWVQYTGISWQGCALFVSTLTTKPGEQVSQRYAESSQNTDLFLDPPSFY
jgi:hypothetical protein